MKRLPPGSRYSVAIEGLTVHRLRDLVEFVEEHAPPELLLEEIPVALATSPWERLVFALDKGTADVA